MTNTLRAVTPGLIVLALLAGSAEAGQDTGQLLLKDFKPESMLRVAETRVERARFPVIDVHNHANDARTLTGPHPSAEELVARMDRANIQKVVILTGGFGESLQRVLDTMVTPYPDRFTVFCQLDWSKVADPGFSDDMVTLLRDAVKRGARGLKILKEFGLKYRDASGKLVAVDDPRLDPVWAECARLGIPVAIHVGDPAAFFLPTDARNERYEELQAHPDWAFSGKDFPSLSEIHQAVERVFARHPRTSFVWLHVGNWPENLDYIGGVLNRRPNVVVEISARQADLGRSPRRTRAFITEFQDRVLFGLDASLTEAAYRSYFRWLETEDEYFDYYGSPGQGRWKIYGLGLPDAVLEKVYRRNAERILGQVTGEPGSGR
jgi:predicted TIM-barrel fold metal-dependent hydrolase